MRLLFWLGLMFLSACHNQNLKPHSLIVDSIVSNDWKLSGKMSLSDGQDGGSGSISWSESEGKVLAIFKAPLGQGSWQLDERKGEIKNSKGQSWSGFDMSLLLRQQLGWEVPWVALKQSVKGISVDQPVVTGTYSRSFVREGWQIEWKNIKEVDGLWLPHKIFLKKAPYSVKISVKSWSL